MTVEDLERKLTTKMRSDERQKAAMRVLVRSEAAEADVAA